MADFKHVIGDFLIDSDFIGCVVVNQAGEILFSNQTFDSLIKAIEGSVTGYNFIELFRNEEQPKVTEAFDYLFEEGSIPQREWVIVNKYNEQIYLDVEGRTFEDNGEKHALACFIDRTNERDLKKELNKKSSDLEFLNLQQELAIETAKLGIWKLNPKTGKNIWNDELLNIYELSREEWEENLDGWQKMLFEEDMIVANNELAKAFAGEKVFDVRFRIKTKTGKIKHILASAAPFFDRDGEIFEVHGINIDVTNLVEVLEEANIKDQYFKNITDKLPGLVVQYYINPDGTDGINYLSNGVEKLYGIKHEEASKDVSLIWSRVHPDDVEKVGASLQESAKNLSDWNCTFRATDTFGNEKFIQCMGTPHTDDIGRIIWDTIALDITEQTLKDEEIQESKTQLQNFTDQLPGVALRYYLKPDGTDGLLYLSKGVEKIHEIDRDDTLKDASKMWGLIHPDDIEPMQQSVIESAAKLTTWEFDHRIITPNGTLKYISSVGIPHKSEDGTVIWDTISMEVTRQKESESALRESQQMLDNLTNQVPGMVYIYQILPDGSDRFAYQSKGIEDVFEISQEEIGTNTSIIWDCIHPDDVDSLSKSVQNSADTLTQWNNVYRIITPSGITKYIQGSGTPVKLADGTMQWYSMGIDITNEIEQQSELREKQKHLNIISDHFPGVIYTYIRKTDGSEELTYLSKGVETIHGISLEDAYKDPGIMWSLVHDDDITEFLETVEASAKNLNNWEFTFRVKIADGSYHWFQGYGKPTMLDNGSIAWSSITFDIHDQIVSQQKILGQKEQLESITNQIQGVVLKYRVHPDGTDSIPYISDQAIKYWGVDAETVVSDISKAWARVVPDDIPLTMDEIQKSMDKMEPWNQVMRFISETGEIKHLHGYGIPKVMEDGTVEYDTVMLDVTEQELAKKEALEKQRQLELIGDQIPGVVFTYFRKSDGKEGFTYFSDGFEELHGFEKSKALENPKMLWDQVHPEDLPQFVNEMVNSAESLSKLDVQYRIIRPDGELRYLQGFGSPTMDEHGTIVWNAVNLDITERKLAELEANISNTKLRAFIKSSPIAIYQINPEGVVTDFWNAAAEQVYGWTRDEVIDNVMPQLWDEDMEEFRAIIEDIRISKKPKQFQVTRHNRYNEEIILEITAGPLFDELGKLTDLLIIANDITELEEYRKTLESALREKEILLQEIHHRVKNNLAIVSGLLELQALKDDNEHDMSLIIEARNRIHSIAMVHEQLYQDMDFSHINPAEYYKKLLSKLQSNTISKETDIDYDLKFDIEKININRAVPLGLLINELFTNSIKHAFLDGTGNLTLHFTQIGEQIQVVYEDDGPGFVIDEIKDKNTIGWQLIETLLIQLDSTYTMDTTGKFRLEFEFTEAVQGSQAHFK